MRDTPTNMTTNTPTIGEVVVKGTVTSESASGNRRLSDNMPDETTLENSTLDEQTQTLKNTVSRLESELKEVTSHINCLIHGEFDDLRNYVDQALERDRLQKRD
ncbi:hypothetical protein P4S72_23440 [Vibrio sp. PP-XX7]